MLKIKKKPTPKAKTVPAVYKTTRGKMYLGKIEDALDSKAFKSLEGKINLILTSPPFPLITKKQYGNETGHAYLKWLSKLAPKMAKLLTPDGSIVIEIGNAWVQGEPTMSTLTLEALLAFKKAGKLKLCQHIICHNPARLPTPAAWVTVKRLRLKDTYTHVWWLSRSKNPKADNRNVLLPYSRTMKALLKRKTYNFGRRPSGHVISETGFLKDHGGAIAPNVLLGQETEAAVPASLLRFSATGWDASYRKYCEAHKLTAHPARMQTEMAAFFISFLTDRKDLVFDPFGGSNTTGAVAESLGRSWISLEAQEEYARGSLGRFKKSQIVAKKFPAGAKRAAKGTKNGRRKPAGPAKRKSSR